MSPESIRGCRRVSPSCWNLFLWCFHQCVFLNVYIYNSLCIVAIKTLWNWSMEPGPTKIQAPQVMVTQIWLQNTLSVTLFTVRTVYFVLTVEYLFVSIYCYCVSSVIFLLPLGQQKARDGAQNSILVEPMTSSLISIVLPRWSLFGDVAVMVFISFPWVVPAIESSGVTCQW